MIFDLEAGRRLPAKASSIERYERALEVGPQSFSGILGGEEEFRPLSTDRAGTVTMLDDRRPIDGSDLRIAAGDPLYPLALAITSLPPDEYARLQDIAGRWFQRPA